MNNPQKTNRLRPLMTDMPRVYAIASGKGGVGKSVIAFNLAQSLAKNGRILLIDGDFQMGNLHLLANAAPEYGWQGVCLGQTELSEAVRPINDNLDLLASTGGRSNDRTYTSSVPMSAGTVNLSMTALPQTGSVLPLALAAPGEGGKPYALAASFGNTGIKIGGRTIPLSFDTMLLLTVQNLLPGIFQKYQGTLSAGGTASASLLIPATAALKGITLHHAFVVIDPSKPGGIGTISNGLPVTLY